MYTSGGEFFERLVADVTAALHVTDNASGPVTTATIRIGIFLVLEVVLFVMFLSIASLLFY